MQKIILITSFLSILCFSGYTQTKNFIDQPYIEVNGTADSLVIPDLIYIKIIISEKERVPIEASETKMITALKSLGINTETNLTTSDILSNYSYYLLRKKDIIKSKEYMLKVSDAATASKVFIQLENLEISNSTIDRVDHTNIKNIESACRIKAIENAREKAVNITRAIGQTVGKAIHVAVNDSRNDNVHGVIDIKDAEYSKFAKTEVPKMGFEKIMVTKTVLTRFILQ